MQTGGLDRRERTGAGAWGTVLLWGLAAATCPGGAAAEPAVTAIAPLTVAPGGPARLEVSGKDLAAGLRGIVLETGTPLECDAIEPTRATASLPLPAGTVGPITVLAATSAGPGPVFTLVVDDLPMTADNGANASRDAPQDVVPPLCIDGTTAPGQADCYRFPVAAGQRIAIEVVARQAGSTLDPVVRLYDEGGRLLAAADDRPGGLDCRLAHTFAAAGRCTLEVRHASHAGSHRYHLRIGDFPLVSHCLPLAVSRGAAARVAFGGSDGAAVEPVAVSVAADAPARGLAVAGRLPGGRSSAWVRLLVHDAPQVVEGAATGPLPIPVGVSGRLERPRERDVHVFSGRKDARLVVTTRARSLGCGTVPRVRVLDPAGKPIAETPVSEADEPEIALTLPADGDYRLEIDDLAGRGGPDYGYFLAIEPAAGVTATLKADAKTRDAFAVEPRHGCAAVDVAFKRSGYDGPLEVSFAGPAPGLRIENPTVPAKAVEARIYLAADDGWTDSMLAIVRLVARPTETADKAAAAGPTIPVTTASLRRIRVPAEAFPAAAADGAVALAGVPGGEPRFKLAPQRPVELVRTSGTHAIPLVIERLDPRFTGPVTISAPALPPGFSVAAKTEKDTCLLTLTGSAAAGGAGSIRLLAVSTCRWPGSTPRPRPRVSRSIRPGSPSPPPTTASSSPSSPPLPTVSPATSPGPPRSRSRAPRSPRSRGAASCPAATVRPSSSPSGRACGRPCPWWSRGRWCRGRSASWAISCRRSRSRRAARGPVTGHPAARGASGCRSAPRTAGSTSSRSCGRSSAGGSIRSIPTRACCCSSRSCG
jgi:hypothetical protein